MHQKQIGNLIFFESALLKKAEKRRNRNAPGLIQAVSTRVGGISPPTFDSLNLSFASGDKAGNILENRRRFCEGLEISPEALTSGKQVHRAVVKVVNEDHKGAGGPGRDFLPSTDGLITNKPGIPLLVFSADCPLVQCYDPVKNVIGLVHASWRGLVENICTRTVKMMKQTFGSQPEDIYAVISPSIGPCCYEVKNDFISIVTTVAPYARYAVVRRRKCLFFNLWSFVQMQLHRAGLLHQRIEIAGLCTKCHPQWFYSFRRDGAPTGRFGAVLGLR